MPACCWPAPTTTLPNSAARKNELRHLVSANPADAYAHLMLGRTLQRQSRHDEAIPHLRLAEAMTDTDER